MTPRDELHLIDAVRKVAAHRRADGEKLIEEGRLRGGMYILGYAIECALKAYIGRHLGAQTLVEAEREYERRYGQRLRLTAARGHNLEWLFQTAERLKLFIGANSRVSKAKNRCLTWDHRWRYDPAHVDEREAHAFLQAVTVFHDWLVQRQ